MRLWTTCPVEVRENEPLADKTTWRIGGRARYFAEPGTVEELSVLLREAESGGIRVRLLGGGSNLLVSDGTLDGLVVRLSGSGGLGEVERDGLLKTRIVAGGAAPLAMLVQRAAAWGLTGLEDLAGIPGTVGGAVAMNAGNPVRGIGSNVESLEGVDRAGRRVRLERHKLHFAYRWSNISDLVVTRVTLMLREGSPPEIEAETKRMLEKKRNTQPVAERSAGCVFKNPPQAPAGLLIEQAGMKGESVGHAVVSERHANFIVNRGQATFEQTRTLMDRVRNAVRDTHGVELALEIRLWV